MVWRILQPGGGAGGGGFTTGPANNLFGTTDGDAANGLQAISPATTRAIAEATHDGTLACDTAYEQADFPLLFATIVAAFNDGSETGTEFRTPKAPDWSSDPGWQARIRF